jgi:hypothetical protein
LKGVYGHGDAMLAGFFTADDIFYGWCFHGFSCVLDVLDILDILENLQVPENPELPENPEF